MFRIVGLLVVLIVVLPLLFAYAATFNISYDGSGVIVVPIEDVITIASDTPAPGGAGASVMPSREPTGATPALESTRPTPVPTASQSPRPRERR